MSSLNIWWGLNITTCKQWDYHTTRSSKVTFKHCPKLKDAYTGPSEMLELISSACIHNNVRHHTELFEKSNKINEGKTHSKPATKSLENLCN